MSVLFIEVSILYKASKLPVKNNYPTVRSGLSRFINKY